MTQPTNQREGGALSEMVKPAPITMEEKLSRPAGSGPIVPGANMDVLKDLLEKNIRWSQAIYEQNKKILRRIFWSSIFTWIKVFITIVFVVVAVFYASSWYRSLQKKYPFIFGSTTKHATTSTPSSSTDEFLKVLPISDAQREQLKALIK